jgi:hypothetical protein
MDRNPLKDNISVGEKRIFWGRSESSFQGRKSIAFFKVPRLRPLILLTRAE